MSSLYSNVKCIAELGDTPIIVAFSTGRDSCVMLDLLFKYYKGEKHVVFFYFVPNLFFKEKLLKFYEKKYQIQILRRPSWDALSLMNGRKVTQGECFSSIRRELGVSYIALGLRKSESFFRRGILKEAKNGIDEKTSYLYPLADWNAPHIMSYVRANKLLLPREYSLGYHHDLAAPGGEGLIYIKQQYPEDYAKIISCFPSLEALAKKEEMYGR